MARIASAARCLRPGERSFYETRRLEVGPAAAHVLVVDDNVDGAEMLAELLRALGYRTAVAHDGPPALESRSHASS
jgi:PleD family two-component response regulator